MCKLNHFSSVDSNTVMMAAKKYNSPIYLYDEKSIIDKCNFLKLMPNAYGLKIRYAMKANPNRTILKTIVGQGLKIDASSLNEVRRAYASGVAYNDIILTSQEIPLGEDLGDLEGMMLDGLKYNVCSLRQLRNIGGFASKNNIPLAIRIHPGIGSGRTHALNTGDKYSCFGVHLADLPEALDCAREKGLVFDYIHVHIGSGSDPNIWRNNIDLELDVIANSFPDALTVSFGGGFQEARMPDEIAADMFKLGTYAKKKIKEFYQKTGRKLKMEIEPGTYITANAGFVVTQVIDKKKTGNDGINFIVLNGGMELNSRPLMYGAQHPFYIVSPDGELNFSEFYPKDEDDYMAVVVGTCCETGDSQCLTPEGKNKPRRIAEPEIGDFMVIGGTGAYCSSMAPMNYNSHAQVPEILYTRQKELRQIRARQTLGQIVANEL